MRIAQAAFSSAFLLIVTAAPAPAQRPVGCEERMSEIAQILKKSEAQIRARWASHRRFVLTAEPGEAYYAPRPYPRNRQEILEDFRYAYFERLFDQGPDQLDPRERSIYQGLNKGALSLEIERVENWTTSRCSPARPVGYYHLIRIFQPDGEELARATILPTGLLGQYAQVNDIATHAFVTTDEAATRVRQMLGRTVNPKDTRYAALDGLPLRCDEILPCTVFQAEGRTWILDRGALLYQILDAPRRVSVSELRAQDRTAGPRPLGPSSVEAPLVTQGFSWVEATLVAKDEERARSQGMPASQ